MSLMGSVCKRQSISNYLTTSLKILSITSAHLLSETITLFSITMMLLLDGEKRFNLFPEFYVICY